MSKELSKKIFLLCFSTQGRINLLGFWCVVGSVIAVISVLVGISSLIPDEYERGGFIETLELLISIAVMTAAICIYFTLVIRRLHDIGLSGWWYLVPVLISRATILGTVIAVFMIFSMALIPSSRKTNKWGAPYKSLFPPDLPPQDTSNSPVAEILPSPETLPVPLAVNPILEQSINIAPQTENRNDGELPKSIKIKIALSVIWAVIIALFAGVFANDGYSGFQFASFLGVTLFFNLPLLLYWLGFWIWGNGYLFKIPTKILSPVTKNPKLRKFLLINDPLNKHPWRRYWARMVDYILWSYVVGSFIEIFEITLPDDNNTALSVIVIASWAVAEAIFLASWGTTPGKFILGISVRSEQGNKLNLNDAMERSGKVFLAGMGLGLPIVNLVTMAQARGRLVYEGITSWDKSCGSQVLMKKVPTWGILIVILALASVPYTLYHTVQIETSLAQFEKHASNYPQKRQELLENYLTQAQALLSNVLLPENLATEPQILNARQNVMSAKSLLLDTKSKVNQTLSDARSDIHSLDIPTSYRSKMSSSYEDTAKTLDGALTNFFQIEQDFLDLFDEILFFLQQRLGQYAVQDGQFLFQSDDDLAQYNSYIQKISEYSEKEAAAIKGLEAP